MADDRSILFADLEHAAARCDPQFVPWVLEFLAQPDPPAGQPEDPPDDYQAQPLPPDAWSLDRLRQSLNPQALAGKTDDERQASRTGAWAALLASPNPPPRLRLGQLLLDLYAADDEPARALLLELIPNCRRTPSVGASGKASGHLQTGRTAPRPRHAGRSVLSPGRPNQTGRRDISRGTWLYMRRRAWRYLRQLGQICRSCFRCMPAKSCVTTRLQCNFRHCWIANQIWRHKDLIGATDQGLLGSSGLPDQTGAPRFRRRLENQSCAAVAVAGGCPKRASLRIRHSRTGAGLQDTLRHVEPAWLARLGAKRLDIVHDFIIKLLRDNPEFHQSKLKQTQHDMVLGLLYSGNSPARRYAIDYARTYATDLPVADLVKLVREGAQDARTFAIALLEQRKPAELGLPTLLTLLTVPASAALAKAKLQQRFPAPGHHRRTVRRSGPHPSGSQNATIERQIQHIMGLIQQGVQNADFERILNNLSQRGGASARCRTRILSGRQGYGPRCLLPSGIGRSALYRHCPPAGA